MSSGLTRLFVCVYWFGIFLEINVLRRVELWPWLWYHPCWFSTTKTRLIPVVVVVVGNVDDFICWNFTVNSQCDDDVLLLLSAYFALFLCIFRVQPSQDNGDKCVSALSNLMKLDELTRISHQFSEGNSHNDQCFLLSLCLVCTVRIFYKPQISY